VLRAIHEGLSTEDAADELIASLDARLVQLSDTEDA
jgi:hypothetical protein